jgi:hypothetical protein
MNINLSGIKENIFESLKELLSEHKGSVPIYLNLDAGPAGRPVSVKSRVQVVVGENLYVLPSEKLIQGLDELLGEDRLSLVL